MRSAVFFDRDGTLIVDKSGPVELLPDVPEMIRKLNDAGTMVIVVTNQSAIALGKITLDDFRATTNDLARQLTKYGARIDATYFCPHHPTVAPCPCRKPGLTLFRRAMVDHDLDPRECTYIGDRWRDVSPALQLGGRGVLVSPDEDERWCARKAGVPVVSRLADAF